MVSLIGALIGLGSSFLPEVLGFFKQREDNQHELAVLELQIKRDEMNLSYKLEEIQSEADIREVEALQRSLNKTNPVRWIEGLIGSVRPVLTYAFFMLYAGVKASQIYLALGATGDLAHSMTAVWHDQDQAVFATIIAFWFGHRMMRHWRRGD